jgi:hypothetical protein
VSCAVVQVASLREEAAVLGETARAGERLERQLRAAQDEAQQVRMVMMMMMMRRRRRRRRRMMSMGRDGMGPDLMTSS